MEFKFRIINWKSARPMVAQDWALQKFENGRWVTEVSRSSDTGTIRFFLNSYGCSFESVPVVVRTKK